MRKLLQPLHSLVPHWGLVKRGEYSERVYQCGELKRGFAVLFEFEDALAHIDEKLIVIIHLLDDLDDVRDQLILNSAMTCIK